MPGEQKILKYLASSTERVEFPAIPESACLIFEERVNYVSFVSF